MGRQPPSALHPRRQQLLAPRAELPLQRRDELERVRREDRVEVPLVASLQLDV